LSGGGQAQPPAARAYSGRGQRRGAGISDPNRETRPKVSERSLLRRPGAVAGLENLAHWRAADHALRVASKIHCPGCKASPEVLTPRLGLI